MEYFLLDLSHPEDYTTHCQWHQVHESCAQGMDDHKNIIPLCHFGLRKKEDTTLLYELPKCVKENLHQHNISIFSAASIALAQCHSTSNALQTQSNSAQYSVTEHCKLYH